MVLCFMFIIVPLLITFGESAPSTAKKLTVKYVEVMEITASSTRRGKKQWGPQYAIDGKLSNVHRYFLHTKKDKHSWAELKLPNPQMVSGVELFSRTDCCVDRLRNVEIRAGLEPVPAGTTGQKLLTVNARVGFFPGPGKNKPGKNRPGKNRHGKNRPGKNRPGKNRPGKNRPGKNKPGKNRPGKNRPGKNRPRKNRPGKNRPGKNGRAYKVMFSSPKLVQFITLQLMDKNSLELNEVKVIACVTGDSSLEAQVETCNGQQCGDGGGLPNSEFPGIDSEKVCSKQSCDPQIMKLYKNSSFIEMENLLKIDEIKKANQMKGISWVVGTTSLSSISYSEVQAYRMGEIVPSREERRQTPERNRMRRQFLTSLERNRGDSVNFPSPDSPVEVFTTDANNQGECSSCAAFAVTAALETCVAKVLPNPAFMLVSPKGLSSQNMLDCAFGNPGIFGCDGGQSFRYLEWLKDGTLDTDKQYPYLDSDIKFEGFNNDYRACFQSDARATAVMNESHSSWDDHTERDLENVLLDGHAIITTMDVQEDFMFYKSGVYQSASCQKWKLGVGRDDQWEDDSGLRPLRHAVVIVGFGEEKGQKYWKVKNSWGENWGSSGFFKILRDGSAHCGLGAYFSVALCMECGSQGDCKARNKGSFKPAQRPPPSLPEEGISAGFTSHLATPLSGVGLSTCPGCANLSECPKLVPCRTKSRNGREKCCRVFGGSGHRLYCPSRC